MDLEGIYFTRDEVEAMRWLTETEIENRAGDPPDAELRPSRLGTPVPPVETIHRIQFKVGLMPTEVS